jgi:hypothetical protein
LTPKVERILGRYPYTYVFTGLNNYIQRRSEIQVNMPENEKAGDMAEILHVDESTSHRYRTGIFF